MKIAQLAPLPEALPPHKYGGTPRVVHWLTEELVRSGAEVDLYASGDSKTSANLIACCEVNLSQDGRLGEIDALHTLMVERLLRSDTEYDIVHSHLGFLPLPQFRHSRLPALSTVHHPVNTPERKLLYSEYSDVPMVSCSDSQRAPLPMANWAATIHHGLPEDSYSLVEKPHEYLLFLGRVSIGKGLEAAVEIARRSGIHLKVAAKINPSEQQYFERDILPLTMQPGVEFIGEVGDSQKQELAGNALALLFPIRWQEPFGLVMLEAMACGTPIVAFDYASVPEIVTHGKNGFICSDVDSAVNCVKKLNQINRNECRQIFEQRFTAKRMARDYMQVYRDLPKHRARSKYLSVASDGKN